MMTLVTSTAVVGAGRHEDAVAGVRGRPSGPWRSPPARGACAAASETPAGTTARTWRRRAGSTGSRLPCDRSAAARPTCAARGRSRRPGPCAISPPTLRRPPAGHFTKRRGHVAVAPRRRAGGAPDEAQQRRRWHVRRRHLTRCFAWLQMGIMKHLFKLVTAVAIRSRPGAAAGPQPSYLPFCSAAPKAHCGGRPHAGRLHGGQIRRDDAYYLVREEAEPALRVRRRVALGGFSQLAREGLEGLALVLHL